MAEVQIHQEWKELLDTEFRKPYFEQLIATIKQDLQAGKTIYPKPGNIFKAFNLCTPNNVKVVILGQDPYHGAGQAQGLSFSVPNGFPLPPSLQNIFKELASDTGQPYRQQGDLTDWASQGVLLLNAALSVRSGEAMSHSKIGWEQFTDAVIKLLSSTSEHLVFILWGKFAQQKADLINTEKHLILKAAHPSPLSAHNGFLAVSLSAKPIIG